MSPPLHLLLLLLLLSLTATTTTTTTVSNPSPTFLEAPSFRNPPSCLHLPPIHISMTLDSTYLRGSLAGILSILHHSSCPQSLFFHFISIPPFHPLLLPTLSSSFPSLSFHIYPFNPLLLLPNISPSLRPALNQPLNYARIYLPHLLPVSLPRVIYLDSDLILLDDIKHLWSINLSPHVIGAPEYCHANLTRYFTHRFWSDPVFPNTFKNRKRRPCYFNTGVMVMDLVKWRAGGYTRKLERWMEVQKRVFRIYDLGSLPPFLLVFAGEVKRIGHRWNQHGLGGDNVEGQCRNLHPGPVSLLHWSGKGKPWLRLDAGRPCQLDGLWKPYDLLRRDLIVD